MPLISFRPTSHAIRKLARRPWPDVQEVAVDRWEIAPATKRYVMPAKFLSGQLERIRGAEFGSVAEVVRAFRGGVDSIEEPTIGFRLREVDLVDGVLYARGASRHLRRRNGWRPAYAVPTEVASGALYESWGGNTWFGLWLVDDCMTYRLAEQHGVPLTTTMAAGGHVPQYERLFGMCPRRVENAHFDELILFADSGHNDHRKERAERLRERLIEGIEYESHPGVFLLRGQTGMRRLLTNEQEIAEALYAKRGFRVIDPSTASIDEIAVACAGARVIAGVEGSHLAHGLMVMRPDASLFVIQPPCRAVAWLKLSTDRHGIGYSLVVGEGGEETFSVSWEEIDQTLDLTLA